MNDCLKEPALFVGDINDEIDLSLPPTSGEDYIKRVVIEAKRCESVVVAEIDESRLKKPTVNVKTLAGCIEAPHQLKPTLEWQQCQIADFSDVRLEIAGLRSRIHNSNSGWKLPAVTLPEIDDQSGWIKFCTTLSPMDGNLINPPTLSTIFSMSHPMVEQVLEYLVENIETEDQIRPHVGQWIYALLTVLELPLNPDACSCLRSLARACSAIRVDMDSSDEHRLNTLNLFICLVARYFRQLDLVDS
ncbi:gem-associated protein 2 [Venturia canescens]|uniref:gem-associated protein 2 n=1 Tax=Venturia canescens TaxID=32260 RepID=UPI001C9C0CE9|nr:gem-associated protein 2 [Venturia canescens]